MSRWSVMLLIYALATAALVIIAGFVWWAIVIPFVIFHAYVADGVFRPSSQFLLRSVTNVRDQPTKVALTFDDGPDPTFTPAIAKALESHKAHATFFCIGRYLDEHPEIARQLLDQGHELGNHSYSHSRLLNFRTAGPMRHEILEGAAAVTRVGGAEQPLYRPPVGLKNPALARIAHTDDLTVVLWSVHSRESWHKSASQLAAYVLKRIAPGDIVLFHDGFDRPGANRQTTVEALGIILKELSQRGLECVTVSELLKVHPPKTPQEATARSEEPLLSKHR